MSEIVRIDFEERNEQWVVTTTNSEAKVAPGEPFPASGHENFTKLEQVLSHIQQLGYRPIHIPYHRPNRASYSFEVVSL